MATVVVEPPQDQTVKAEEKGSKSSGKTKSSLPRHKTRSPGESMKESERELQKLLEDFENGKLNAFGLYIDTMTLKIYMYVCMYAYRQLRYVTTA